jgi:Family of unknown function (DUF5946)
MDSSPRKEFEELSYYTLAHSDMVYFIHQHVVDAFQAQTADKNTKPIGLIFSLIGLHLYLDKMYTGRQVQQAHMKLAQNKKVWTMLDLPEQRGTITVSDVMKVEAGKQRDMIIRDWCASVWTAYKNWHDIIANLAKSELGVK